jgi:2-polyprenyl-3-methyl-5-hydroxy-6-metoxy-1,4-benzoquinol methylase
MNNLDDHLAAYEGDITFDFDNNILLNWYPKRILEQQNNKEFNLLELGLGHGYSTNIFSNYYHKHVVIDGSKSIINNFQKKYPYCRAKIVESFFETFDTDEKFDLIVMGFVLEHVDNPVTILKHFQKFLKPNGVVYASVPNAEVMNRRLGVISGLLSNLTEFSDNDYLLGHQRYYTKKTFSKDIQDAGYELLQMEGIYLKPLASSQVQKLNLSDEILNALCVLGLSYPELSCGLLAKMKLK